MSCQHDIAFRYPEGSTAWAAAGLGSNPLFAKRCATSVVLLCGTKPRLQVRLCDPIQAGFGAGGERPNVGSLHKRIPQIKISGWFAIDYFLHPVNGAWSNYQRSHRSKGRRIRHAHGISIYPRGLEDSSKQWMA